MLNIRNKILALICIILGLIGYYVLHDKENDAPILAVVGSSYISVDEFIKSYSFGSSQLKAKENPKLSYLEAMINERILAQDLSKNKKYSIEDSDLRIELLRKELIVEKIFENQVEDKVEISDEEVLKSILDAQKKIKISYLYSTNYDQILECDHLISNGHDFVYIKNSLGQEYDLFINQTPFMNNNQIVEPFKNVIFNLVPGNFSKILRTDIGYYIIKIDDIITRSLSAVEIQNSKSTHIKIIKNRKSEQLARNFVKSFMSPKNIKVDNKSFHNLANNLFKMLNGEGFLKENFFISNENQFLNWLNDSLIVHSEGIILTKEILKEIRLRPFRFNNKNIKSFKSDFEKKLAIIIRDYFLVLEHEKFGEINYSSINGEISHWKRKFIIDDFIQKFHKNSRIKKIDYDFFNEKLDSIKTKINISINMQLLSEVEVFDKIQGQIPELQLFKLGLPYLKKAYPTPSLLFKYVK